MVPLHEAALLLDDAVVELLLQFAPADAPDSKGRTPLMCVGGRRAAFASRAGQAEPAAAVVRRLVAAGGRLRYAAYRGG
jgi:hypothetical protein